MDDELTVSFSGSTSAKWYLDTSLNQIIFTDIVGEPEDLIQVSYVSSIGPTNAPRFLKSACLEMAQFLFLNQLKQQKSLKGDIAVFVPEAIPPMVKQILTPHVPTMAKD